MMGADSHPHSPLFDKYIDVSGNEGWTSNEAKYAAIAFAAGILLTMLIFSICCYCWFKCKYKCAKRRSKKSYHFYHRGEDEKKKDGQKEKKKTKPKSNIEEGITINEEEMEPDESLSVSKEERMLVIKRGDELDKTCWV
ncbi:hypothetical protein L596_021962 [Steinernema carpocapsae]|uniref:Uncharacterized protein n=1 Tax=Steinernema carpocapsae TaxID=34508 RepID=A0A4U5MKE7_STECR|nr:hypothetical protein L596_021962 [Steinernema carpocapsae]